jgi:hypothetical protein
VAKVTQIERYRFLLEHWKGRRDEAVDHVAHATAEVRKWQNKLIAAEIAEQIALDTQSKA